MFRKYSTASVLVLLAVASCKTPLKNGFTVSIDYTNADKLTGKDAAGNTTTAKKVYLEQIVYGKDQSPSLLDSASLSDHGTADLATSTSGEGIYELVFGNNLIAIPLINDAAKIKITTDLSKKDDFYTVSGSDVSTQMQTLIGQVGKKNFVIEQSMKAIDSLKRLNATDSALAPAIATSNAAFADFNAYIKGYLNTSTSGTLSVLALSWASRSFSGGEFDSTLNALTKKFPNNSMITEMKKSFDANAAASSQQSSPNGASWVGKPVPELVLPDANGNNISLASFKGKFVLVDFWASWCGPCRMENPNVVRAYNKFKDKNFTIVGVSLDKDKDAWQAAVAHDHLAWTHISDLKYWNSKAVETFGFQGIPFNVLVDPSGKVVAQELRGEELDSKLAALLR